MQSLSVSNQPLDKTPYNSLDLELKDKIKKICMTDRKRRLPVKKKKKKTTKRLSWVGNCISYFLNI